MKQPKNLHIFIEDMTLLDWFAGQALIPLLAEDSKDSLLEEAKTRGCASPGEIGKILAESCYNVANDMLKEKKNTYSRK